ncbi:hypothetical protein PIGBHMHK_00642 [Mycoplasmopsis arginini]|uniref:hypothetical protein n=1 Tax=Mycoplasmopsis arginini TaxID=2094 RepID=UPI00249EC709|nr:hypothetical protein [Mycoplasmopsis arginini]MDI3349077.1 hypothetical protein [Mycoplasmopsis arginini]
MATKNMAYDSPAYLTPVIYSGVTVAGAAGVSPKFAAFTAQKIMSVTLGVFVASTAAGSQPLLYTKSGTATATTTLTALTSASTAAINNAPATPVALAQGDQFWVTHGTDATAVLAVAIETLVIPGANVTA